MMSKNNKTLVIGVATLSIVTIIAGIYTIVLAKSRSQNEIMVEPKTSKNVEIEVNKSPKKSIISSGTFVSGEHPTSGKVIIVNRNNQRLLRLSKDFETSSMGPDLVLILHRESDVIASTEPPAYPIKQGDYVIISPLRSFNGTQTYEIPDNVNLNDFQSVAIWCRRFNATFGTASLKSRA